MIINNACIRVTSDSRGFKWDRCKPSIIDRKRVDYFVIPHILATLEPEPSSDRLSEGFWILHILLGQNIGKVYVHKTYFTSRVRAEVCRDDILEAIDKFYKDNKPKGACHDEM